MTPARVGAFFDIDGTILPPPSLEWRFAQWLFARDLLDAWQITRWAASSIPASLTGDARALRANKVYLAGLPCALAQAWDCALPAHALVPFPNAAQRIAWHAAQDHRIVFVSGTLAPLASLFARRLSPQIEVRATRLQSRDNNWTGAIAGEHMSGQQKSQAIARVAAREGISLDSSFAYGNHADDTPMLEAVGNPVAVNPTRRLQRIAAARRWPVAMWPASLRENPVTSGHTAVAAKESP